MTGPLEPSAPRAGPIDRAVLWLLVAVKLGLHLALAGRYALEEVSPGAGQ